MYDGFHLWPYQTKLNLAKYVWQYILFSTTQHTVDSERHWLIVFFFSCLVYKLYLDILYYKMKGRNFRKTFRHWLMVAVPEMKTNSSAIHCQLAWVRNREEQDQSIHCFLHMMIWYVPSVSIRGFSVVVET